MPACSEPPLGYALREDIGDRPGTQIHAAAILAAAHLQASYCKNYVTLLGLNCDSACRVLADSERSAATPTAPLWNE